MPNTTYGSPYAQSSDLVSNWPGVSLNIADRIDDVSFKGNGLNDQTGTTYTLVLTDAGKTVTLNNASAVTVTVPTNSSVAYETGTCIYLTNKGAGVVTISAAGGVTLNNSSTLAQYASCYIQKLDTNTWVMVSGPTAGLTLIASSSFAAVSSVSINNCFSSTYQNYRILFTSTGSVSNRPVMRLRVGGVDSTTNYAGYLLDGASNAATAAALSAQFWPFVAGSSASSAFACVDLFSPAEAVPTGALSLGVSAVTDVRFFGGRHTASTAYDGFTLYGDSSGNITGNVRVYGYRNS